MRRGRPIEFDRNTALDAAIETFWINGYEGASLSGLLDAMGIARSSFYQAFGSKEFLYLQVIERYKERLVCDLRASLEAADTGMQFISDTLRAVARDADSADARRGCLVFNSAAEFGQRNSDVAARVSASIAAFSDVFADAVRRAQDEGDIARDRDPRLLGRFLVGTMSGLRTHCKAGATRREIRDLADLAVSLLG